MLEFTNISTPLDASDSLVSCFRATVEGLPGCGFTRWFGYHPVKTGPQVSGVFICSTDVWEEIEGSSVSLILNQVDQNSDPKT